MQEKDLRTSTKQRVIIGGIAVAMVATMILGYAAIVANGGGSSSSSKIDEATAAQYQQEYEEAKQNIATLTQADYDKLIQFKPEVTAYNEEAANAAALATEDLVIGEGRELTDGDTDYMAYYIGWCADESIFDSSLDSTTEPTRFISVLDVSSLGSGLIEGWKEGVVGMKLGGVREITVPQELAYKDTKEVCGGLNKPLKFMILAVPVDEQVITGFDDYDMANLKAQYAQMGVDYNKLIGGSN